MDIKTIGVEEWLNVWEKSATWDIAQSTISSLTMGELRALDEQDGATFYERLDREKMNYGWIEGSPDFKARSPNCIVARSIPITFCRPTVARVPTSTPSWLLSSPATM